MSDADACNCTQAVELQAELDRARVRISNLEYQNSNLRGRLDALEHPSAEPSCWHCGCDVLPPTSPTHCFDCPSECDGCDRCEWRRTGAAHTPGGGQLPDEGGPAPGGAGTTRPPVEPVASILETPAGRMAMIAELASPTQVLDADTGKVRAWPPIISKETAAQLASEPLPSLGADYAAYLQAERDRPGLLRRVWRAVKSL